MVIVQYELNNEYVPKIQNPNCGCGETDSITSEVNLKIALAVTASYMIYSFVQSDAFPETMMRFTYKAVLVYTKVNKTYNNFKTYFNNMINNGKNSNNDNNNESTISDSPTDSFTDYEIRVIKNGIKCEQFETMKIFKKSNYLGNPNDYCDSQDEEESQSQSSTTGSCDVCDVCDSQDDGEDNKDNKDGGDVKQDKITTTETTETTETNVSNAKNEQLFIMKHEQNNTIQFVPYDFIMQTLFCEPGANNYSKLNKNYTRLYRQFTENSYSISPNDLVISKAGMIVCSLELKGKIYDIDISFPYNFNVVGNIILDYTFLSWYILKEYEVAHFTADCEYTLTCISNANAVMHVYKLGKSSGLLVNLNEYEIISV
uniref:Uncharacterized protein n=1 Tax=viral metagenome TaxID=1070528 RepID=A0A6C0F1A9_9ZZZZ